MFFYVNWLCFIFYDFYLPSHTFVNFELLPLRLNTILVAKTFWLGCLENVYNLGCCLLYPPQTKLRGYIVILMSVRSFVRSSVRPPQSLIRYSSKTAEQNFMKFSGIVHYMMPYCTSYFKFFIRMIFGFPKAKQGLCHYDMGGGGPISNPLLL